MKINKMKGAIGVLAVTAVVSLVGSISGTMAWLQYNTRARVEMYGTTAKCTENLQIRTITGWDTTGTAAVAKVADEASLPAGENGQIAIAGKKVFTHNGTNWGTGATPTNGDKYKVDGKCYAWNQAADAWKEIFATYGDWKSALLPSDISKAADVFVNLTENQFKPVTNPAVTKDAALGDFYSHPLAGHELYKDDGVGPADHIWKKANDGYLQFAVQFRVVDVDGKDDDVGGTGKSLVTLAQSLYMTDLSYNNLTTAEGKDVKSALRMHIENVTGASNKLLGFGAADTTESYTTVTHGNLDLDGDRDLDTIADVPNNYSWTPNSADLLDYGKDRATDQTYYNVNRTDGSSNNVFFATQDKYGALIEDGGGDVIGQSLGTTTAGTGIADDAHLTFKITMWLEGWHSFAARTPATYSRGTYASAAALPAEPTVGDYVFNTGDNKMYRCTAAKDGGTPAKWEEVKLGAGEIWYDTSAYQVVNSTRDGFSAWTATTPEAMWSDLATVGAEWNLGMSFAVPALEPIQA